MTSKLTWRDQARRCAAQNLCMSQDKNDQPYEHSDLLLATGSLAVMMAAGLLLFSGRQDVTGFPLVSHNEETNFNYCTITTSGSQPTNFVIGGEHQTALPCNRNGTLVMSGYDGLLTLSGNSVPNDADVLINDDPTSRYLPILPLAGHSLPGVGMQFRDDYVLICREDGATYRTIDSNFEFGDSSNARCEAIPTSVYAQEIIDGRETGPPPGTPGIFGMTQQACDSWISTIPIHLHEPCINEGELCPDAPITYSQTITADYGFLFEMSRIEFVYDFFRQFDDDLSDFSQASDSWYRLTNLATDDPYFETDVFKLLPQMPPPICVDVMNIDPEQFVLQTFIVNGTLASHFPDAVSIDLLLPGEYDDSFCFRGEKMNEFLDSPANGFANSGRGCLNPCTYSTNQLSSELTSVFQTSTLARPDLSCRTTVGYEPCGALTEIISFEGPFPLESQCYAGKNGFISSFTGVFGQVEYLKTDYDCLCMPKSDITNTEQNTFSLTQVNFAPYALLETNQFDIYRKEANGTNPCVDYMSGSVLYITCTEQTAVQLSIIVSKPKKNDVIDLGPVRGEMVYRLEDQTHIAYGEKFQVLYECIEDDVNLCHQTGVTTGFSYVSPAHFAGCEVGFDAVFNGDTWEHWGACVDHEKPFYDVVYLVILAVIFVVALSSMVLSCAKIGTKLQTTENNCMDQLNEHTGAWYLCGIFCCPCFVSWYTVKCFGFCLPPDEKYIAEVQDPGEIIELPSAYDMEGEFGLTSERAQLKQKPPRWRQQRMPAKTTTMLVLMALCSTASAVETVCTQGDNGLNCAVVNDIDGFVAVGRNSVVLLQDGPNTIASVSVGIEVRWQATPVFMYASPSTVAQKQTKTTCGDVSFFQVAQTLLGGDDIFGTSGNAKCYKYEEYSQGWWKKLTSVVGSNPSHIKCVTKQNTLTCPAKHKLYSLYSKKVSDFYHDVFRFSDWVQMASVSVTVSSAGDTGMDETVYTYDFPVSGGMSFDIENVGTFTANFLTTPAPPPQIQRAVEIFGDDGNPKGIFYYGDALSVSQIGEPRPNTVGEIQALCTNTDAASVPDRDCLWPPIYWSKPDMKEDKQRDGHITNKIKRRNEEFPLGVNRGAASGANEYFVRTGTDYVTQLTRVLPSRITPNMQLADTGDTSGTMGYTLTTENLSFALVDSNACPVYGKIVRIDGCVCSSGFTVDIMMSSSCGSGTVHFTSNDDGVVLTTAFAYLTPTAQLVTITGHSEQRDMDFKLTAQGKQEQDIIRIEKRLNADDAKLSCDLDDDETYHCDEMTVITDRAEGGRHHLISSWSSTENALLVVGIALVVVGLFVIVIKIIF